MGWVLRWDQEPEKDQQGPQGQGRGSALRCWPCGTISYGFGFFHQ